jgi:hypothetical protein
LRLIVDARGRGTISVELLQGDAVCEAIWPTVVSGAQDRSLALDNSERTTIAASPRLIPDETSTER